MLKKKIIRKEISVLHYIMLATSNLFIGTGIGIVIAQHAIPWGFPIMLLGVVLLLPSIFFLFKVEEKEEEILERKVESDVKVTKKKSKKKTTKSKNNKN